MSEKKVKVVLCFHRLQMEGEHKTTIEDVKRIQIHTDDYGNRKIIVHRDDDVTTYFENHELKLVRMSKYFS